MASESLESRRGGQSPPGHGTCSQVRRVMAKRPTNAEIADVLERVAALLEVKHESPYRIRAYRAAAQRIRAHSEQMVDIIEQEGIQGLRRLPAVGRSIAAVIAELVETGGLRLLERLEEEVTPEQRLAAIPGIGPVFARRLCEALDVTTLEELELAAYDGRLERIAGFGPRRTGALRAALGATLNRTARRTAHWAQTPNAASYDEPSVEVLLRLDEDYRVGAELGVLPCLAPRRFNPSGAAWLPILETNVDGWSLRAMYSNTWRAHQLHATHDWVVIHYERGAEEGLCTVVTETHSEPLGERVIRGREAECRAYYATRRRSTEASVGAA